MLPDGDPGVSKCPACGYSLAGTRIAMCPECGQSVTRGAVREYLRDRARVTTTRMAYLVPAAITLIASAIWMSFVGYYNGGEALAIVFASRLISIVLGTVGYFLCCLLWIGFDAPWRLTILRLAAVHSSTIATFILATASGSIILALIATLIVYLVLLTKLLDMELREAFVYAVLCWLLGMIVEFAFPSPD